MMDVVVTRTEFQALHEQQQQQQTVNQQGSLGVNKDGENNSKTGGGADFNAVEEYFRDLHTLAKNLEKEVVFLKILAESSHPPSASAKYPTSIANPVPNRHVPLLQSRKRQLHEISQKLEQLRQRQRYLGRNYFKCIESGIITQQTLDQNTEFIEETLVPMGYQRPVKKETPKAEVANNPSITNLKHEARNGTNNVENTPSPVMPNIATPRKVNHHLQSPTGMGTPSLANVGLSAVTLKALEHAENKLPKNRFIANLVETSGRESIETNSSSEEMSPPKLSTTASMYIPTTPSHSSGLSNVYLEDTRSEISFHENIGTPRTILPLIAPVSKSDYEAQLPSLMQRQISYDNLVASVSKINEYITDKHFEGYMNPINPDINILTLQEIAQQLESGSKAKCAILALIALQRVAATGNPSDFRYRILVRN